MFLTQVTSVFKMYLCYDDWKDSWAFNSSHKAWDLFMTFKDFFCFYKQNIAAWKSSPQPLAINMNIKQERLVHFLV